MTECDEAVERLYQYLDGELPDTDAGDVRRHLESCSDCYGAFDFERRIIARVRRIRRDPVPPELVDRLRTFLSQHAEGSDAG
ncbi:MAG: zf-HC2 domain-containing protein [Acidimicrobiia bacterium]